LKDLTAPDRTGWPGRSAPRLVSIENARHLPDLSPELSIDTQGFALVKRATRMGNFGDENEVRAIYYPEIQQLLMQMTGANKVIVFAHDLRSADPSKQDGKKVREPVSSVHNDYTLKSAPEMVRELVAPEEAERLLKKRFVEINIWRPLNGPPQDRPLAICDARSIAAADLVATDQYLRHEVYMMTFSPRHRWFYFPNMETREAILIKGYDSMNDGRARFTAHGAFVDPSAPPDAPPRESIEARAFLFFA
jgi:hypothetical protein